MILNLSIEVVKPTNCSWEQAGNALRQIQKACIAGANLAQTHLIQLDKPAYDSVQWDGTGLSFPRNDKNKLVIPPLGEKASQAQSESYKMFTDKFEFVSSRIASYVSRQVLTAYKNNRFSILVGNKSVPSYRNFPIMTDWCSIEKQDNNIIAKITLLSTKSTINCPKQVEFILLCNKLKGLYKQVFDEIIEGKRSPSTVKLVYRKNKWMLNIPFEIEAPTETNFVSGRTLYVYPVKDAFLKCSTRTREGNDPQAIWSVNIEYESMKHTRNIYQNRMRAISSKYKQDSNTCAVGRGKKRAFKNKDKFADRYNNACKTFNQQRASYIIQLAQKWKCENINYISPGECELVKSAFDSWPWYQLEQCIKNKAEQFSIKFSKTQNISEIREKFDQIASNTEHNETAIVVSS